MGWTSHDLLTYVCSASYYLVKIIIIIYIIIIVITEDTNRVPLPTPVMALQRGNAVSFQNTMITE